jgi:hypothetical protein
MKFVNRHERKVLGCRKISSASEPELELAVRSITLWFQ